VTLSAADLSTLGDGTISVSVAASDAAGNTSTSTGSPRPAVARKKWPYPSASTNWPEKPASHLGSSSMMELKSAYCVAE